jgi:hypothetical protein
MFANTNNFILDQKKFKLEVLLSLSKGIKPHDVDGIKANLNLPFWKNRCKATDAALLATFRNCSEAYKKWVKDQKPMAGMDEWVYHEFLTTRYKPEDYSLVEVKTEAGEIEMPSLIIDEEESDFSIEFSNAGGQSSKKQKKTKRLLKIPVATETEQPTEAEAVEEKPLIFVKAAVKANPFVSSSSSNNKEAVSVLDSVVDSLRKTEINSQEQLHRLDLIVYEIGMLSLAVNNMAEKMAVLTGESETTEPFNPIDVVNAVASSDDPSSGSYTEETVKSDPEMMEKKNVVSKKDRHLLTLLLGVAMTLITQNNWDLITACLDHKYFSNLQDDDAKPPAKPPAIVLMQAKADTGKSQVGLNKLK